MEASTLVARTERFSSTHNAALLLDYRVEDRLFSGLFRSSLLSSTTLLDQRRTNDQIDLLADMHYDIAAPVNLFFLFEGTMTNDAGADRLIPGIDNTAATFIGVGGRAVDRLGNKVGLAVGGAYNRQLNTEDAGGAVYADGSGGFEVGGYRFAVDGNARWYNTSPRLNGNIIVNGAIDRDFGEGIRLTALGSVERISNDLYIKRREEDIIEYGGVTYDGILQRRERRFRLATSLIYPIGESVGFDADIIATTDAIGRRETEEGLPPLPREPDPFAFDQRESAIGGSVGAWYMPGRLHLTGRLTFRSAAQKNVVDPIGDVPDIELRRRRRTSAQNDYLTSYLLASGNARYQLTRRDTVSAGGSVSIYRYDTPDTTNNVDRDEATIVGELRYARRFSRLLHGEIEGQVFLNHLVYLFGENSNDNNWNRVFRLSPSILYTVEDRIANRMRGEIVANYTEYDFQGRTQNIRGRSFRELTINDSLVVMIGRRYGISAAGELRIAERGSFSWEKFAESLLERTRTELLELEAFRGRRDETLVALGGKLSRVRSFRVNPLGAMIPFSDRTSVGPTARAVFILSDRSTVEATGWWEHQFVESELVERVPWLFLTVDLKI